MDELSPNKKVKKKKKVVSSKKVVAKKTTVTPEANSDSGLFSSLKTILFGSPGDKQKETPAPDKESKKAKPVKKAKPTKKVKKAKPDKPTKKVKSTKKSKPTKPTKKVKSTKKAKPTKSAKKTKPTKPIEKPKPAKKANKKIVSSKKSATKKTTTKAKKTTTHNWRGIAARKQEKKQSKQAKARKKQAKTLQARKKARKKKDTKPFKAKFNSFMHRLQMWRLPEGMTPTNDMSDIELAEEAKTQRHLLKDKGLFDSAMFNPGLMNIQYLRVCQYIGAIPFKPYLALYVAPIALAILFGITMAVNMSTQQAATSNLSAHWGFGLGVGAGIGGFIGISVGFPMMAVMQFKKAYANAMAFQLNEFNEPLICFSVPVLRMACIDNPNLIFTGSGEEAGFDTGDLLLRIPDEVDISQITQSNEVCKWPSLWGSFIGSNAREDWSLQTQAELAGKVNPRSHSHKSPGQVVKEWAGVLILTVCFVGCIFVLSSQSSTVDPSKNSTPNQPQQTQQQQTPNEQFSPQPWNNPNSPVNNSGEGSSQ